MSENAQYHSRLAICEAFASKRLAEVVVFENGDSRLCGGSPGLEPCKEVVVFVSLAHLVD